MKLYDITDWCKLGLNVEDYPYIGEVDIDVDTYEFGTLININGDYYAISVLGRVRSNAGARKIKVNLQGTEHKYKNNITCPYCGYEDRDSWERADKDDEHECGQCRGIFSYGRVVTVEYNSYPKEKPDAICGNWVKEDAR